MKVVSRTNVIIFLLILLVSVETTFIVMTIRGRIPTVPESKPSVTQPFILQTDENGVEYLVDASGNQITFYYPNPQDSKETLERRIDVVKKDSLKRSDLITDFGVDYLNITNIRNDGKPSNYYLIRILANNWGGGYQTKYFKIYDPFKDKTYYESHGLFYETNIGSWTDIVENGHLKIAVSYHRYDYCVHACSHLVTEFIGYDAKTDKFVSQNTKHKEEIGETLKGLNEENRCSPKNRSPKMTFEEIKEKYGEDNPCASSDESFNHPEPGFDEKPYNGFPMTSKPITPKEYFTVKKAFEDILNGKEVSLMDLDI